MISIHSRKQLKELQKDNKVGSLIADMALADLITFEVELDPAYYTEDTKPTVVVMDLNEHELFKEAYGFIDPKCPEYVDIVHAGDGLMITKSLYLMENGESGIVVYTRIAKGASNEAFTGDRFVTSHAEAEVSKEAMAKLFEMLEVARVETGHRLDYLQVFELIPTSEGTLIRHRQEQPEYSQERSFPGLDCASGKMFWISSSQEDGQEYSTLMMAEDY
jgi:hypothetical protein